MWLFIGSCPRSVAEPDRDEPLRTGASGRVARRWGRFGTAGPRRPDGGSPSSPEAVGRESGDLGGGVFFGVFFLGTVFFAWFCCFGGCVCSIWVNPLLVNIFQV